MLLGLLTLKCYFMLTLYMWASYIWMSGMVLKLMYLISRECSLFITVFHPPSIIHMIHVFTIV